MTDPFSSTWVVLVEVGTEFPEVFGPFSGEGGRDRGAEFMAEITRDERVESAALVPALIPSSLTDGSYWAGLDLDREDGVA